MVFIVLVYRDLIEGYFSSETMVNMGYSRKEIEDSLLQNKYDDITATYLLLGRRIPDVIFYVVIIKV